MSPNSWKTSDATNTTTPALLVKWGIGVCINVDGLIEIILTKRQGFGSAFWFAQRDWHPQSAERSRCRLDQGEDNPNRKGVAGNGRV